MKRVVRYLLEGDGSVPTFVVSGGFFMVGPELVGVSVDESERHVPLSVARLTKQQLVDRFTSMSPNRVTSPGNEEIVPMNAQDIADYVDAWLTSQGIPDYV